MTWSLAPEIEAAVWDAVRRQLPARACQGRALHQAIVQRSLRYTREREHLAKAAPNPDADLAARAVFFGVADAAKIAIPLAELRGRDALPGPTMDLSIQSMNRRALRILDLGAGAGAMTLGALAATRDPPSAPADSGDMESDENPVGNKTIPKDMRWEIRLIDRDRRALAIAQDAIAQVATGWGRNARVTTERGDVTAAQFAAESADLVVAGGLLNELDAAAARELVRRAVSALAPGGAAILIEPALRETTRALHHLRDWVIDEGIAHVFAPCTRRLAPCPALADDRDWCHEDRPTNLPERAARLAAATGLRTHGLKFAYLVLRADEAPRLAEDGALRVVSQPSKQKGRRELFACGDDGRLRLRLLRKNRGPDNRAFERARRGDVLVVDGATEASPAATVTDIAASTRVDARSPA